MMKYNSHKNGNLSYYLKLLINFFSFNVLKFTVLIVYFVIINGKSSDKNQTKNSYSKFYCVDTEIPNIQSRNASTKQKSTCLFHNVCIKNNNHVELLVYREKNHSLLFNQDSSLIISKILKINIKEIFDIIPKDSYYISHRVGFVDCGSWGNNNFGHLIIDNYASSYINQLKLGLIPTQNYQIISLTGSVDDKSIENKFYPDGIQHAP